MAHVLPVPPPVDPSAEPRRARRTQPIRPALVEVPRPRGPHVRLGVVAMTGVLAAALAGPGFLAATMALVAALAAASIVTRHRSLAGVPAVVAVVGAAAAPLAALAGGDGVARAVFLVAAGGLVGTLGVRRFGAGPVTEGPRAVGGLTVAMTIATLMGLAAAGPVLSREVGLGPALALLAMVSAHDAGAYVVGVGAHNRWEGPAAGAVAVAVAGFPLAVFNVFGADGNGNALLVVAVAVLAPVGPMLARALCPRRVPAVLGRLDVLLVVGPIWPWISAALR